MAASDIELIGGLIFEAGFITSLSGLVTSLFFDLEKRLQVSVREIAIGIIACVIALILIAEGNQTVKSFDNYIPEEILAVLAVVAVVIGIINVSDEDLTLDDLKVEAQIGTGISTVGVIIFLVGLLTD